MTTPQKLAIVIWFYMSWFGCVLLGNSTMEIYTLIFPLLPFGFFVSWKIYSNFQISYMLTIAAFGVCVDALFFKIGFITFLGSNYSFAPIWLISIWLLFSSTFFISHLMFKDRLLLSGFLSTIFGPLSYYSGTTLKVIEFHNQNTLLIYAIFWGLFYPGTHLIYKRMTSKKNNPYSK